MKELTRLISRYGERYSTAVIYVSFVIVSLLVSLVLFGILHSTGIMKLVFAGAIEQAEFGGAFSGFIVTLILLIRFYNQATKDTRPIISGNVLYVDGNPVEDALVFVEGIDRQKETDATGWFAIEVNEQKSWVVRATYKGKVARTIVKRANVRKPANLVLSESVVTSKRASAQDDLALNVSANNEFADSPDSETLEYRVTNVGQKLRIEPQMVYLTRLADGGPISALDYLYGSPFRWQLPNLDLKLVNNSNSTLFFTDVIFEVEKSIIDPWPILVICDYCNMYLRLVNEGWGEVYDCSMKFNIIHPGQPVLFDEPYHHEVRIGTFSESHTVDLSEVFRTLGVDVQILKEQIRAFNGEKIIVAPPTLARKSATKFTDYVQKDICVGKIRGRTKRRFPFPSSRTGKVRKVVVPVPRLEPEKRMVTILSDEGESIELSQLEYQNRRLKAMGPFTKGKALICGELLYSGMTIEGNRRTARVKFAANVLFGNRIGAVLPPTCQYKAMFEIDRSNYQVRVPISQVIRPGEADRFNILIGAPKSSVHTLRLRLLYNNGQSLMSPPMELKILVPRSQANRLEKASAHVANNGD